MDLNDLNELGLTFDDLRRINDKLNEIKVLYGIGEADYLLIQQLSMIIRITMNLSPELQIKLVKAYSAMVEVVHDEMTAISKRKKK